MIIPIIITNNQIIIKGTMDTIMVHNIKINIITRINIQIRTISLNIIHTIINTKINKNHS